MELDCLETFVDAKLLYREPGCEAGAEVGINYSEIEIPAEILDSLKENADRYWATEVRKAFWQVNNDSPVVKRFVTELEEPSDLGDMEKIVENLKQLPEGR